MNRLINWFNLIIKKQKGLKRWQRVVTVLAAMITFATTYALILPAITVEKNSTEDVGGMYLEKTAKRDDLLEDNALEPVGVSIAADMDNAVSFAYSDDDLTATAIFSTDEIIPEGAELVVNSVTSDSEEYPNLSGRAAYLLDKEFIYDVTTCSFYDFALVCDNVDVTPNTGLVDIQIIFRNNTNQHVNDVVYAGRFARPSEDEDGFAAMAVSTVEAGAEADDAVSVNGTAVNDNSAGESGNPSAGEDELVSLNIDESSVIELSDGIITSLSLKGSDLSRSDSLVGIIAGYVDEEIKAAAAETDAEIPEYDESQDEDEQRSSGEDASANADNNVSTSPEEDSSGTSAEDERKEITDAFQMKTLKASGSDYTVILTYDETSGISEKAVLTVSEIAQGSKEYNTYLEETKKAMGLKEEETLPGLAARFFDIKIMVGGKEFNPESGVSVEITYAEPLAEYSDTEVNAVHFANEKAEAEMIEANTAEVQDDGKATVEFTAESFSVYGVIYTVDFHWEVDGKTYDFSMPGGGFVSFYDLVEVLGIEVKDTNTEKDEIREFVNGVEHIEFSNPELVSVSKVDEDTTVGAIKDGLGLECIYSAELTEEEIKETNASEVRAGDWVLIAVMPFDTVECLTVTMVSGESFEIRVTDAIIPSGSLENGNSYVLYAKNPSGQIFALRGDGYTYQVEDGDLDSLSNEYLWRYEYITDWPNSGTSIWWSQNDENRIELWDVDMNSALSSQRGSYIRLESAPNGGYYFTTYNGWWGTYALWLYNDKNNLQQPWRFVSGDANQYNRSEIFIYEREPLQKYTVNVNDAAYGQVRVTDNTDEWVTNAQSDISRSGKNAHSVFARAKDGYWFDHWELDNQPVEANSNIVNAADGSGSVINAGALDIGNQEGHVLTAVFVPETIFNIEASPSGGGSVNRNSSPRTKDGYNKELISAEAANGWWFGHWEIDGVEVPSNSYSIAGDGMSSSFPAGTLEIGDGGTLTAVFIPQITYDVVAVSETQGSSAVGCTVKVGDSAAASSITGNAMTRDGYTLADITAEAGPGYVFKGWMLDDEPILGGATIESALDGSTSTIEAGTLRVSPDGQTHTVKAVFAQEYNFTVTTYPSGGGIVQDGDKASSAGPTIYASMTKNGHNKYQIAAQSASGYSFSHWTKNGLPLTDGNDNYLYTNGIIPAESLTLTSSDIICAVFVENTYEIVIKNDGHGNTSVDQETYSNKDEKTCLTYSNASFEKQARRRIIASPDNNYKFAYWAVDQPDKIVDWGSGSSATSTIIKPIVNDDTTLTAIFVPSNTRTYIVTVDDPSHGTVYGQRDVQGSSTSVYGSTTFVGKVNSSNRNDGQIEVRTIAPGYKFVGWNVYYPNGTLYQSYTNTNALKNQRINSNSVSIPQDGMVIKAMFEEKETPPAFEDSNMDELSEWADDIAETKFSTEKTAEVFDYDNRIYRVKMSASSQKQAIDSSVVINFITDTSRSMYFPANLYAQPTDYTTLPTYNFNDGTEDGKKIREWLRGKNTNNVYYFIGKQNTDATVYALYHNGSEWVYVDASYYGPNADDGQTRAASSVSGYNRTSGDNGIIYTSDPRVSGKPWSRLDYLVMSVETAVKVIYEICPNAQIDLTTFNRASKYWGTIPNDTGEIERILRNIDVAGGTRQDLGLETATPHFTEGSSKKQIAVLITDGAPNITNSPYSNVDDLWDQIEDNAEAIRGIPDADGNELELYAMGLSLGNVGNNAGKLSGLVSEPVSTHFKSVENGGETKELIMQLVNDLLSNVSLFGTATDTVDPAFYPVDKDGNPISAGLYAADGSTLNSAPQDGSPYYEWTNSNGNWSITWYNQTFAWADGTTPGWEQGFYIKAKEDFLGGNKISTNAGNDNGVIATGFVKADTSVVALNDSQEVSRKYDYTPYVNVDELHMGENETEWTVYLGTEVDPATQIENLLGEIPVKQVVLPGGTDDSGIYITDKGQMYYPHDSSAVDNEDASAPAKDESETLRLSHYEQYASTGLADALQAAITQLAGQAGQSGEKTIDNIVYNEYGHAAGKFTITVTKEVNAAAANDGAPNPHETKLAGDEVETYTLNVKYTPYTAGAATTYDHTVAGGSAGQVTNGTGDNEVISRNEHVINVIEKGIRVVKTDSTTGEVIDDCTAEFKLYRALKQGESSNTSLTVNGTPVPVIEVTDLVTSGAANADKVDRLPWYKAASEAYNGRYFLKETEAPEEYLLLSKPVEITVTYADAYTDLDGESVEDVTGIPYNDEQTAGVTVVINGQSHAVEESFGLFEMNVPDPPKGSLAMRKAVQTINADISDMNGWYTFLVSGPVGSNEPYTYYVAFKVVNGEMTEYWFEKYAGENATRVLADRLDRKTGTVTDQDSGYVITDIETGIYFVQELPWDLDNEDLNDDIYLRDIILNPATGGNTNDVIARTTTVLVTPDKTNESVLTVTFVNEYAPENIRVGVQKLWQDEDGTELTEPWDETISTIEFSVVQIENYYTSDPDVERTLTFDDRETLMIRRYGWCAFVSPAGEGKYDIEWASGGDPWHTLISGLEKRSQNGNLYGYKIKELVVRDMMGNVVTGYETTYDLSVNGGDLLEENSQYIGIENINDGATAYIRNKKDVEAGLNLKKIVEAGTVGSEGDGIPLTSTNGSYTFTVTGPEGSASSITKYVKIYSDTTDHGELADPRYTTAYTYQIGDSEAERDAMEPLPVVNGGVPIEELEPGLYTITEDEWSLDEIPYGSEMHIGSVEFSSGSNNVVTLSQNKAEVYLGEGEIGSLAVAFRNRLEPYPGIRIEKIDETTRPEDITTEYLEGAEFQILRWNGLMYEAYPDDTESRAVTDGDGVAVFDRVEPGEYQIVETVVPKGYIKKETNDIFIHVEYSEATGLNTITRYEEAYTGDDGDLRTVVGESEELVGVTYVQATETGLATIIIGNYHGAALPSTGGLGTTLLYFLGIILTGIAGAILIIKRRIKAA